MRLLTKWLEAWRLHTAVYSVVGELCVVLWWLSEDLSVLLRSRVVICPSLLLLLRLRLVESARLKQSLNPLILLVGIHILNCLVIVVLWLKHLRWSHKAAVVVPWLGGLLRRLLHNGWVDKGWFDHWTLILCSTSIELLLVSNVIPIVLLGHPNKHDATHDAARADEAAAKGEQDYAGDGPDWLTSCYILLLLFVIVSARVSGNVDEEWRAFLE